MSDKWYINSEAGIVLCISTHTIKKRIKEGKLNPTMIGGILYVYFDSEDNKSDMMSDKENNKVLTERLKSEVEYLKEQFRTL